MGRLDRVRREPNAAPSSPTRQRRTTGGGVVQGKKTGCPPDLDPATSAAPIGPCSTAEPADAAARSQLVTFSTPLARTDKNFKCFAGNIDSFFWPFSASLDA